MNTLSKNDYCNAIIFEKAKIDDLNKIILFIEETLEKQGVLKERITQFKIATDEIFTNIIRYGYENHEGFIKVGISFKKNPDVVWIEFADKAKPFNPLTIDNPNTALGAEERNIGGLGIYIIKQIMDEVKYKYDGGNVLTIVKK